MQVFAYTEKSAFACVTLMRCIVPRPWPAECNLADMLQASRNADSSIRLPYLAQRTPSRQRRVLQLQLTSVVRNIRAEVAPLPYLPCQTTHAFTNNRSFVTTFELHNGFNKIFCHVGIIVIVLTKDVNFLSN